MVDNRLGLSTTIVLICLLLLFNQFGLIAANAQENDELLTREEAIQALNGPIFLDAYWTDRNSSSTDTITRKEIGPGDGASTLAVVLANRGSSDITAITGTLTLPEGFSSYGASGAQVATAQASFYQLAGAGDTFTLYFDVIVSGTAKVGTYTSNLKVEFNRIREVGAFRDVELTVPFRLTGKPVLEVSPIIPSGDGNRTFSAITASQIEDFQFEIANTGTTPVTNVVATIESPSESMMILGKSTWSIEKIDEDSQTQLSTKVYAADSLIGEPASFEVTVQYSSNGNENSQTFKLGTYIGGEIALRVYDLTINYVGTTPTLVGNILNEGNTAALFTTIELVPSSTTEQQSPFTSRANNTTGGNNQFPRSNANFSGQSPPQPSQQYLGDLTANSPLPFSIPLGALRSGGQQSAEFPVTLKITYKDNLRNEHEFTVSETASAAQQSTITGFNAQARNQSQDVLGLPLIVWIGIAIAVAAGITAVIIKKRRNAKKSKNQYTNNGPEKRENIEDILENPREGDTKNG